MLSSSSFSHELRFWRTTYIMAGFYHLYLPSILQMRSGDIETNPGPNTPESTVSEEELLLLSERIDPSKYKRVGIRLGIPYAVLSGIKLQSRDDYSDAFMQVFMKWNVKQLPDTNTRAILAEELKTCGLGELSARLLDGSLLSNTTFKPSVPPPSPPSSPRQPLSPELIQKCAEDFKDTYRTSLCRIRADPLNPDSLVHFEDMYTNLVVEKEYGRYKQELEYNDLVNLKDKAKFTRRLLVQGEAGAGKTTFCAKIAWDWINGKHFQEFEWVLIVPLREAKKYTIGEIAKSYLTSNNPTTASQLTEYMHLNTDKVFIVFDGLDEFDEDDAQPGEDGSQTSSLQSSQIQGQSSNPSGTTQAELQSASGKKKASSAKMEIGVEEILRSEKLENVPVMVTTRPWKAIEIRRNDKLRKNYTFLYVEGFSKKNVASYIQKYFVGDKAEAESLIHFVNDNDVISENMAPYPIYIAMLCLVWREFDKEKQKTMKALQTFSQIFEEIFVFLKEHYALKIANPSCSLDGSLNDCLKDINQLLEPIATLALKGLLKNTLVFREGDFEHCRDSMKTACRVGVLSEESKIILGKGRRDASNPRMKPTVFFPHKLFQEFMAGIHLASLYERDNREYNRLIETVTGRRKKEFRYLLYFTASQNQRVGIDVLTRIGRSIEEEAAAPPLPRSTRVTYGKHFLVDVAFECHDSQAAAVVRDKVSSENATLKVDHSMTAHTVSGYAFFKTDLASLTVERDCGPTMSREVAEMICSLPSLRKFELNGQLHDNFFTTIAGQCQFSKIQSLTVRCGRPFSASASHDLAVAVGSMPNLTELELYILGALHDEFISTLKAMAASLKIQSLTILFAGSPVSASASHDLAVSLGSLPNLTELKLNGVNFLHDEFYSTLKAMAASMKDCFPQITKGNFQFNGTHHESLETFLHQLSELISSERMMFHTPHKNLFPNHSTPDVDTYVHHSTPEGDSYVHQQSPQTVGSSSDRSQGLKRKSPFTQSRVPQDVPEKQQSVHGQQSLQTAGSSSGRSHSLNRTAPFTQTRIPQDVPEKQQSGHGQQSPQAVGSSSGRSQGLKRTAPCTRSRVPQDVPEKQQLVHGQQLPQTVGSSSGRSQSLKRTAPCTQSRVHHDVPEKQQ